MSKKNTEKTSKDEGLQKQQSDKRSNEKIEKSYHPTPPKPKSDGEKKK